jgi:hypothetical protein
MGLCKNPLRTLLLVNLITWAVACIFIIQSSILLLVIGGVIWMFFGPYAKGRTNHASKGGALQTAGTGVRFCAVR